MISITAAGTPVSLLPGAAADPKLGALATNAATSAMLVLMGAAEVGAKELRYSVAKRTADAADSLELLGRTGTLGAAAVEAEVDAAAGTVVEDDAAADASAGAVALAVVASTVAGAELG